MTLDQDRRIIREMLRDDYAMLSGPAGPRDYDRVKHYFHPAARLVRTGIGPDGEPFTTVMSVDDHHADVDEKLAKLDFLEEELEHDCEIFGNVARVRSVYRSVYGSGGEARENRGVNFFNLVRENGEWKIISVVWDNERDGLSLG
ncbi:MAG: hypothetical protein R3C54_06160 [Parvularculaceae bacterium]